ncbi:hypothetical protein ABZZ17_01985 [Streptomyces sp. NPDC006512]|uniref:hypothetical protein n=1 Tax=Streptomyces sp. NPDC006512 TaxID=3154307 RepID=UPI0033AC5B2A
MNTSTGADRGAAARGIGFRRLYGTVISIAGTVILLYFVIPRMTTQLTGVEGSFTAVSCTPYDARDEDDKSVMCSGSFTAADGSFSLGRVSVDTTFDALPTAPVDTVASGPDATEIVSADPRAWQIPGATGLLCLGFAVWNVTSIARHVRDSRRPAAANPAPAPAPAEPTAA